MTTKYRQCTLIQDVSNPEITVSWIPSRYAVIGKMLKLKYLPGDWLVCEVFGTELRADQLPYPDRDIRHHRQATGDALPKEKTNGNTT